ncbi:hypothetical protein [Agarivorans sp. OAG1]|uniref:hypothetical protein n=1 Tax=Agarivorans sp. OAG1 TaxID=3082387 RepID=UPI0030D42B1C
MNNTLLMGEASCLILAMSFAIRAMFLHAKRHQDWFNPLRIFFKPVNNLNADEYSLIRWAVYALVVCVSLDVVRHLI